MQITEAEAKAARESYNTKLMTEMRGNGRVPGAGEAKAGAMATRKNATTMTSVTTVAKRRDCMGPILPKPARGSGRRSGDIPEDCKNPDPP